MVTLAAGTFRTSDYRKPFPRSVVLAAMVATVRRQFERVMRHKLSTDDFYAWLSGFEALAAEGKLRLDHRPALAERDYDTDAEDFIPPQHSINDLEFIDNEGHDVRTFGAYGVTQRGDLTVRARTKEIANKNEDFKERQAAKAGQTYTRRDVPARKKSRPKQKIRSRGFQKGGPKRKIPSRGFR